MDAPAIQYCKTSDGVSIAYAVVGEGATVVRVPPVPWSHAQREWTDLSMFLVTKPLANRCRTVWFDTRGSGLSDRSHLEFTVDALASDIEAVVDKLECEQCDLVAIWDGVPAAVAFAASHPQTVRRLVLIEGYSRGSDYLESPAGQLELGLRDKDWEIYTEMYTRLIWGYDDPGLGRRIAQHLRACADPPALRAAYDYGNKAWDISELAPRVSALTLVMNNAHLSVLAPSAGQKLAASMANARFTLLDDLTYETVPELVAQFLGLPSIRGLDANPSAQTMAVILFADIADSTALTERLGDAAFRERSRQLEERLRQVVRECGGVAVEGRTLGDGVLATFASAREAIEAGLAMAGSGVKGQGSGREDDPLLLHVGIHAGDVIREEGNVYGGAVNIAARISDAAAPGEVLVSDVVRGLARTSAGVSFEDRGERALKGIDEQIRVWAVRGPG